MKVFGDILFINPGRYVITELLNGKLAINVGPNSNVMKVRKRHRSLSRVLSFNGYKRRISM